MASYEVWHYISIGALAVAGVFLLLAVLMFFGYRIPSVISVLSGKARRKDLERIKSEIDSDLGGRSDYYGKTGNTSALGNKTETLTASSGGLPTSASAVSVSGGAAAPVRPQPLYRDSDDVATDVLPQVASSVVAPAPVPQQATAESAQPSAKKFKFVPPAPSVSDDSPTDVLQSTKAEADDAKTEVLRTPNVGTDDSETEMLQTSPQMAKSSAPTPKQPVPAPTKIKKPQPQAQPQAPKPSKGGFKIVTDETVTHLGAGKQES